MKQILSCGISDSTHFETLWKLPNLPLTERIGLYNPNNKLSFDQELVVSLPTGHVQLKYQLDPSVLYSSAEYSFRTGESTSAKNGALFFARFVRELTKGRKFKSLVDVGGNDLFVAKNLGDLADSRTVIDPVCSALDERTIEGIKIFGRFAEKVNLKSDLLPPDVLLCRHTLEHIAEPRKMILQWFEQCAPDCIYIIEVPCFDNLVEACRFDAIFHQHFHYYSLDILKRLVWELGGEYITHAYHHQVSCGGALIFAFQKASRVTPEPAVANTEDRVQHIKRRINYYQTQMAIMRELYAEMPAPLYGYGAGLMLATLGYHLKSDFKNLICILDDDLNKDGMQYENVPVAVRATSKENPPEDASYIITSLEGLRPIFRRVLELKPRRILAPLIT